MIVKFEEEGPEKIDPICWLLLTPESIEEALDLGVLYHAMTIKGSVCRREKDLVKFSIHKCLSGAERS